VSEAQDISGGEDLEETARWYSEVLGAQPVRILHDRVTFSFGGVLQLVCHLERRAGVANPRAYPRHHGLTFLRMEDFDRLKEHLLKLGATFMQMGRYEDARQAFMAALAIDPNLRPARQGMQRALQLRGP
jgi:extradiol dioxygenase family protein